VYWPKGQYWWEVWCTSQSAAARGLQNVRCSWGAIQQASTVVDALSLFPQSVLQEVGEYWPEGQL
jgi:hypothetical protein